MLAVPTYSRERVSSLSSSPLEQPSSDTLSSPSPQRLFAHADAPYSPDGQVTVWPGTSPKKYQRYKATVPTIYPSSLSPSSTHRTQKPHASSPRSLSPTLHVTPHLYGRADSPYTKFDVYEHYHYAVSPLPSTTPKQQDGQKVSQQPHPEHEQRTLTRVTATTSMSDLLRQETVSPDPETITTIRHFAEENALARQEMVRQWMAEKARSSPSKASASDTGSSTKTNAGTEKSAACVTTTRRTSLYEPKNKAVFAKWLAEKNEHAQRQALREQKRRAQADLAAQAKSAAAAASRQASLNKWAAKKAIQAEEAKVKKEKENKMQAAEQEAASERQEARRQRVQSMPVSTMSLKLAKHNQPWLDTLPPQEETLAGPEHVLSPPSLYNDYTLNLKHTSPHYVASHRLWIAHGGQEVLEAKEAEARRSRRQSALHTRWAPKTNAGRCLHRIL